jgi:hypothetical protein
MRFYEFADAEAQLGLLRTIIDGTWSAIEKQAEAQKRAEAQRKAYAKLKPRKHRASMGKAVKLPTPKPPSQPSKPQLTPQSAIAPQSPIAPQSLSRQDIADNTR